MQPEKRPSLRDQCLDLSAPDSPSPHTSMSSIADRPRAPTSVSSAKKRRSKTSWKTKKTLQHNVFIHKNIRNENRDVSSSSTAVSFSEGCLLWPPLYIEEKKLEHQDYLAHFDD
jgi:hypothetical protein